MLVGENIGELVGEVMTNHQSFLPQIHQRFLPPTFSALQYLAIPIFHLLANYPVFITYATRPVHQYTLW